MNADLELAQRVAAGDPEAVALLVERYGSRLYHFIYYQVGGSHDDAQDVLQETLIGALRSIGSYRGDSPLFTWLCGVAWNKAQDCRRDWQRYRGMQAKAARLAERPVPEREGESVVEAEAERARVWAVLAQLPEHYRRVLVLMYVRRMQMREIARVLGESPKTVESRLTRAREAFRVVWSGGSLDVENARYRGGAQKGA